MPAGTMYAAGWFRRAVRAKNCIFELESASEMEDSEGGGPWNAVMLRVRAEAGSVTETP